MSLRRSSQIRLRVSPTARRRYQDTDILLLQQVAALLGSGATYDQVRQQLTRDPSIPFPQDAEIPPKSTSAAHSGEVVVIEPSDQAAALAAFVEAQRQLVDAQRQHIAQQQEQIAQLAQQLD